jgi:glycosyltransferase involved in cell wall biosynthesis
LGPRLLLVGAERWTSGGEVFLYHLVQGLARRHGSSLDVLLPERAEVAMRIRNDPACEGVRVLTTPHLVRLGQAGALRFAAALVRAGREILRQVRREGYDTVIFNGVGASAYGLVLRLFHPCRQVAIHYNIRSSRLEAFYCRWFLAAHELICISRAVASDVRTPLNRRRLHLIPLGVPIGPPPSPAKYRGSGPLRLLSAGRITPWKGVHVLLEALRLLRDRLAPGPFPVEVRIAGRPWLEEEFAYEAGLQRSVERDRLAEHVRFVGHRPLEELMDWAHCLVHTAVDPEPFGLVVAEAMGRGCLVVVADGGGVREYVTEGRTGYLVRPRDAGALADRLEWLLRHRTDPRTIETAGRAWRMVSKEHALDRQVDAYARVFLGGGPLRSRTGGSSPTA